MDTNTWHPVRGLMRHDSPAVRQHAERLASVAGKASFGSGYDDFIRAELGNVIDLFQYASSAGESVVTMLDLTRTGKKVSK